MIALAKMAAEASDEGIGAGLIAFWFACFVLGLLLARMTTRR